MGTWRRLTPRSTSGSRRLVDHGTPLWGEGFFAGGFEFVAGMPGDGGGGGEGLPAEFEAEAGEFGVGGEVHVRRVVVGEVVVTVGDVVVLFGEAPGGVVAFVERACADGEGGHSGAGHGEVVGAVVVAGFGVGVGDDGEVEAVGGGLDGGIEAGALGAGDGGFEGLTAEGLDVVVVEVEGDLAGGDGRMLAKVFGAEQALLLCGDGGEDDGVGRLAGHGGPDAGEFHEDGAAGGVVGGAVVDVVAGHAGDEAEMVVVGGVEDGLIRGLAYRLARRGTPGRMPMTLGDW